MGILLTEATGEAVNNGGGMGLFTILWLVAIVAFFYFFMIRPQKKEQKKMSDACRPYNR